MHRLGPVLSVVPTPGPGPEGAFSGTVPMAPVKEQTVNHTLAFNTHPLSVRSDLEQTCLLGQMS